MGGRARLGAALMWDAGITRGGFTRCPTTQVGHFGALSIPWQLLTFECNLILLLLVLSRCWEPAAAVRKQVEWWRERKQILPGVTQRTEGRMPLPAGDQGSCRDTMAAQVAPGPLAEQLGIATGK